MTTIQRNANSATHCALAVMVHPMISAQVVTQRQTQYNLDQLVSVVQAFIFRQLNSCAQHAMSLAYHVMGHLLLIALSVMKDIHG